MKHPACYIILFVVVLLASCGADRDSVRLLQQADSLLNVRPDSMKAVLGTWVDSIGHCPERVRMYYNLLRVKADDKVYVTHTSDSLILSIVRYYREQRDKTHLPEALYYAGRTYSDLKDAPRALEYYQRAIDVMEHEELTDYNLLSRIYSQMGTLFFYQELYDELPGVLRKAYQCDLILKDSANLVFDLRDIGRSFAVRERQDSAIWYYNRAGEMAQYMQDSILLSMVYGELAGFYVDWGNYPAACEKLQIAWQAVDTLSMPMYYNNTAKYYYNTNQLDSAVYYYRKKLSLHSYSHKASAYQGLAKIARERGDVTQAMEYYDLYMLYDDSLKQSIRTETIHKIDALYNYHKFEKENIKLKKENFNHRNLIFFLVLVALFSLLLFAVFWQKNKRKEQTMLLQQEKLKRQQEKLKQYSQEQIEENKKRIEELSWQLENVVKDKDLLHRNLLLVQKEQIEKDNRRIEEMQEMQRKVEAGLYMTNIYNKFQTVANSKEKSQLLKIEDWQELQEQVDEAYGGFTTRLKELYPQISEKELHICLLIKIGVTPTQMATIMISSKQDISSVRSRLYTKLSGTKGSSKQCDQLVQSL